MVNKALKKYSRVDAKYSDSDKEYILENWGSIKLATIANKLCRTPKGIIRFTERNKIGGFSKTHEYLSTTEVANMFGVNPSTVINYWVGKYGLEHIRQKINKREFIRITLDDLSKMEIKDISLSLLDNLILNNKSIVIIGDYVLFFYL